MRDCTAGYLGSKAAAGVYQAIIALMPPHDTYIETHLGGGAVLRRKPPAAASIGLDLDAEALDNCGAALAAEGFGGQLTLLREDAHRFLGDYDFTGRELVYCDPPYLHSTRTSRARYRYEYSEDDHRELLDILRQLPCAVILSGYPSALYDQLLPDWNTRSVQAMTRGGVRTEKIWFNFQPDTAFWASYAGENFTDRQRIKRKAQRWASNYRDLPAGERRAIMAALLEAEAASS